MLRLSPFKQNSFCFDNEVFNASGQELPCCLEGQHGHGNTKETGDDGNASAELGSGCYIAISFKKQSNSSVSVSNVSVQCLKALGIFEVSTKEIEEIMEKACYNFLQLSYFRDNFPQYRDDFK